MGRSWDRRERVLVAAALAVLQLGLGLPSASAGPPAPADVAGPSAAGADRPAEAVRYLAPVPGAVVDPWRVPAGPFAAGNRGIDLFAEPGETVRAAAGGEVVFAGAVAGGQHVVVLHPDGLRTTYAFLAGVLVGRGDVVSQGQAVGVAAGPVHFGVRAGEVYLDPLLVLSGEVRTHLVRAGDAEPGSVAQERNAVVRFIGGALRLGGSAASWLADQAVAGVAAGAEAGFDLVAWVGREGWERVVAELEAQLATARLALEYLRLPIEVLLAYRRMQAFLADQLGCTPPDLAPPRPVGRRIAVLVAGFGSDGRGDAVADVDTRALGYADADVAQFSYAGGQVDGPRQIPGLPGTDGYGTDQANGDLDGSAVALRSLLADIQRLHPGVPVDVIAHSQGGVVARRALDQREPGAAAGVEVANLVTIGSPHTGSDAATAAAWIGSSSLGEQLERAAAGATGLDARSPAAAQLVEGSPFLRALAGAELGSTRFTSIASAGDLFVTANHSAVDRAVNVLLPARPGLAVHGGLPGTDAVEREVALAVAGLGPTCRSLGGAIDQVVAVSIAEDFAGITGGLVAQAVDR